MRYDEFVADVRQRGEYPSNEEAERVIRVVLEILGQRLAGGEPKDLAAQLPEEIRGPLERAPGPGESFGVQEFVRRVEERTPADGEETARWDASAVLSTIADMVSGGEVKQVLGQLPAGYAELFGRPGLA